MRGRIRTRSAFFLAPGNQEINRDVSLAHSVWTSTFIGPMEPKLVVVSP